MQLHQSKLPQVGTTIFTVMSQRARELGALNLSQGFPDFAPPSGLLSALANVMQDDIHQYAPMQGVEALRAAALTCVQQLGCTHARVDDITITLGATEALFSSIQAVVAAGDEVIVFDPCYDSYVPAIELCGARALRLPLAAPAFRIDWQRVRAAISPRTRMIIVNTPHNPTATVLTADDLTELAECVRDTRIVVLGDEVYAHMVFDGAQHHSLQAHSELRERSISVFSFGKLLHATGWRVGFTVAPSWLTAEIRKVHQFNTFSIAQPLQTAIAAFLAQTPQHVASVAALYQRKRDLFASTLAGSRWVLLPSAGSFFQLVDYSAIAVENDVAMAETLLVRHGVASIPLSPFCAGPWPARLLRLCFAKRDETLMAAGERLCKL